jgi:hypothetical protein
MASAHAVLGAAACRPLGGAPLMTKHGNNAYQRDGSKCEQRLHVISLGDEPRSRKLDPTAFSSRKPLRRT